MATEPVWGELVLPDCFNNGSSKEMNISNSFPVKGEKFVVGRGKECDLHLPRKQISSHHCYLTKDNNDTVWLYDTSLNGTFINKKIKVTNGNCHELNNGDLIYLVHKKKNPSMDFYLIFNAEQMSKTTDNINSSLHAATTSNAASHSDVSGETSEPLCKKMKTCDDEQNNVLRIKEEPLAHSDNSVPVIKSEFSRVNESSVSESDNASTLELPIERVEERLRCDFPDEDNYLQIDDTSFLIDQGFEKVDPAQDETSSSADIRNLKKEAIDETDALAAEPPSTVQPELTRTISAVESSISEVLLCSLCLEILYDPICLQPCMHCYCSACYSQWMDVSEECPQCRCQVEKLTKNHLVGSLIDAYMKDHPEKRRSLSEIQRLDGLNTITADMLNIARHHSSSEDESVSYDIPFPGATSFKPPHIPHGNTINNCRQCPQNDDHPARFKRKRKMKKCNSEEENPSQQVNAGASSSNANSNSASEYVCPPGQPHAICNCCYKSMPDRRNEADVPPQQCSICKLLFCHMYWGCQKPGCSGCLNKFEEMTFTEQSLQDLVNYNKVETQILFDCLKSQKKNSRNLIQECLARLDDGSYKCTLDIVSSTVLCYSCALRNLHSLAYSYRREIPQDLLSDAVKGRPNCHWGRNCRTQTHNVAHAE